MCKDSEMIKIFSEQISRIIPQNIKLNSAPKINCMNTLDRDVFTPSSGSISTSSVKKGQNPSFGAKFPVEGVKRLGAEGLGEISKKFNKEEVRNLVTSYIDDILKTAQLNLLELKKDESKKPFLEDIKSVLDDFNHEFHGDYIKNKQLKILEVCQKNPEIKTLSKKEHKEISENFAKITNHFEKTLNLYQYSLDAYGQKSTKKLNELFTLVEDYFSDQMVDKKMKLIVKNKNILKNYHCSGKDIHKILSLCVTPFENGIKYSPEKTPIIISFPVRNDKIHFSVKDMGIGIKEQDLSNIGTKGFRSENAQGFASGTGHGLHSLTNFVPRHNINIKSPCYVPWLFGNKRGTLIELPLPVYKETTIKSI